MKTLKLTAITCLLLGALMSCNKGSGTKPSTTTSTTDDAADLVTASLATNTTSGSTTNTNDITASVVSKVSIDSLCGTTWTDSVNRSILFTTAGGPAFTYKATHTYTLDCGKGTNGLVNDSVTVKSAFSGNYSYPVLTGSYTGTAVWYIAGLGHGSPTLTINGEYKRSGTFTSKLDTTFAGTHSIDLVFSNVVLQKPLRTITSGTATFTITGNTIKRGSFTYNGTIVFNGQYAATLHLNGITYLLDLGAGIKRRL
jgi:hypothetical protein